MAALTQQDERLQFPIICNMAKEVWKTKEAKTAESGTWGDTAKRGILMEAITGVMLLLAGADVLMMRHPQAIKLVRETINDFVAK